MWIGRCAGAVVEAIAPSRCAACGCSGAALCALCAEAIEATQVPLVAGRGAAFLYADEVRTVLHHGKFRDCRRALRALAWMGAGRLTPPPGAVVAAVPLAPRRVTERGYNQAEVVAAAFADFHLLQLRDLLRRARETAPQSTLDRTGRRANVAGAFCALPGAVGATVWLVDDVLTTGATTAAAADALRAAGAVRVEVAVLAVVA